MVPNTIRKFFVIVIGRDPPEISGRDLARVEVPNTKSSKSQASTRQAISGGSLPSWRQKKPKNSVKQSIISENNSSVTKQKERNLFYHMKFLEII
jgi:hypothetical protein